MIGLKGMVGVFQEMDPFNYLDFNGSLEESMDFLIHFSGGIYGFLNPFSWISNIDFLSLNLTS